MFEKILVLVIVYLGILFKDVPKLKQTNRRERIVYGILMTPILYLSLVFVTDIRWPNLDELIHIIFAKPAQLIVDSMSAE